MFEQFNKALNAYVEQLVGPEPAKPVYKPTLLHRCTEFVLGAEQIAENVLFIIFLVVFAVIAAPVNAFVRAINQYLDN